MNISQQKGFAIEKEGVSEHWRNDDFVYIAVVVVAAVAVETLFNVFVGILDVVAAKHIFNVAVDYVVMLLLLLLLFIRNW